MVKLMFLGINTTDEAVPDPPPYLSRYPAQKTHYNFISSGKPHSIATLQPGERCLPLHFLILQAHVVGSRNRLGKITRARRISRLLVASYPHQVTRACEAKRLNSFVLRRLPVTNASSLTPGHYSGDVSECDRLFLL